MQSAGAAVYWRLDAVRKPTDVMFGATVSEIARLSRPGYDPKIINSFIGSILLARPRANVKSNSGVFWPGL